MRGAEVVDRFQNGRPVEPFVAQRHGAFPEDQLEVDDLDTAPVAQRDRRKRRQLSTVELGGALAAQVHDIRAAVGPMLDAGVVSRHPRIVQADVQAGRTSDVDVRPFELINLFEPAREEQLEGWGKRRGSLIV